MNELLSQLRRRGRVEDVVLDGDVLIVQLLQETERGDGLATSTEACLTELLSEDLS